MTSFESHHIPPLKAQPALPMPPIKPEAQLPTTLPTPAAPPAAPRPGTAPPITVSVPRTAQLKPLKPPLFTIAGAPAAPVSKDAQPSQA